MIRLHFPRLRRPLRVLCLGAHADDIEIGCAGALLEWHRRGEHMALTWVVLSASETRAIEARASARTLFSRPGRAVNLRIAGFTDGRFPAEWGNLKSYFNSLQQESKPDLVFAPSLEDRHQDHRLVAELAWQTWRNAMILEYEIPKYEGDLQHPSLHVHLARSVVSRKLGHLTRSFPSQRDRSWFSRDTFLALLRIRGIESRADSGYAEAFHVRKWNL